MTYSQSLLVYSILGLGVALAIQGHYTANKTTLGVGIALASAGFTAVVAAALGFGAAASRIEKKFGILFKGFSISGGCLIAVGYALKQWAVSDHEALCTFCCSLSPSAMLQLF